MRRVGVVLLLALTIVAAGERPAAGASRVLPRLAFHVLRTPHFRVYYHQGLDRQARLLAKVAESVWATVPARLGLPAPATTHVLLVDQDDASNGWATPLPYDTVMITAAWPPPSDILGNTSDWLRIVFTHEYTHVLHLHQSRGWARAVKAVFGRAPLAFPNLFLPGWSTEGLATFSESRFTGQGRLNGGDSVALVAHRARQAGPERMDQVTGGQVVWPAGLGPYLYGGFFAEYLAKRFGEEKLGELGRRTAGRLPYFASAAYEQTFGEGLSALWRDYQRSLVDSHAETPGHSSPASGSSQASSGPTPRRLTHDGYYVTTPRFTPDGRAIVYGRQNADDFPAVAVTSLDPVGPASRLSSRRLAIRYGGEQLSVHGRLVFFDAADYEVNVAWRSDLYAADIETGRVQRLTRNARLASPEISPDGRKLACLDVSGGGRRLVLFDVRGPGVNQISLTAARLDADPAFVYGSPRWSPDGSRLAVERRHPGGPSEIAVLDVATGRARVVASSPSSRNVTPAWTADGRTILFSSDRDGRSFQVYSASVDSGDSRPVLAVPGGAMSPELSPDGARLVYVGYTAAGYDLFDVPFATAGDNMPESDTRETGSSSAPEIAESNPEIPQPSDRPIAGSYSPFFTLLPRSWQPAADYANNGLRLGFSTGGVDLLARHSFGVTALWRIEAGADAMNGPERGRPDWSAFYSYDRWRPAFLVAASDETSFPHQSLDGVPQPDAELRKRQLAVGTSVPFVGVRRVQVLQAAFNVERDQLSTVSGDRTFNRNAIRAGWAYDDAHQFGFSISPEQGIAIGLTSEPVRAALGADGNADAFTAEFRGYLRLGGHSVLATRVAAGVASGDRAVARVFFLGGPQPAGGLIDFSSDAFSMLRGFEDQAFAGRRIGAANVEYRFPLWRMERGKGNWPIFLRTLHGAVFADAGQAWDGAFSWGNSRVSVGGELSIDTLLGFGLPVTVSGGVAVPIHRAEGRGPAAYVRVGRAF